MLHGIWTDPASVDPRLKAAEVTRDIAKRLSRVAEALEKEQRGQNPGAADFALAMGIEETSLFLMRVLFCMFAEDVELLEKGSFTLFLEESRGKSDRWWQSGLNDLWKAMNNADELNRFWNHGDALVRHFNGNLFSSAKVFDLPQEFKGELYEAARRDWRSVEPAIFGTLLEQVLTTAERAKLGAHYTPRPYVQRLVSATFGDLLNEEWAGVEEAVRNAIASPLVGEVGGGRAASAARRTQTSNDTATIHSDADASGPHPNPPHKGEGISAAITLIQTFHTRLCALRILDPACGTGNFLYVSMEELLRLEGKALALAESLGTDIAPAVHPNQFLGLELNPRAAVIAELVLWIGWLRHRLANHPQAIGDPVLPTLTNINGGTHGGCDAVLRRTATSEPDTENPMVPDWPEADFIVGNPPFIGSKYLRELLGSDYAEALWKANPRVPASADFVMPWWDHAAHLLTAKNSPLRRFGFVTTNSITQTFSRRVIEGYLHKNPSPPAGEGKAQSARERGAERATASVDETAPPVAPSPIAPSQQADKASYPLPQGERSLSLILAIPDHPWTKATPDAAAVRIAMTVAEAGAHDGRLLEVIGEQGLTTDDPIISTRELAGVINADLTIGTNSTTIIPLSSNQGLSARGVGLFGDKFLVTASEATHLGLSKREGLVKVFRLHRNGRDIVQTPRSLLAIDLFGLSEKEVRVQFPELYQYVLEHLKPHRENNRRTSRRDNWWLFGEQAPLFRQHSKGLRRYLATPVTSKHRIFVFLDATVFTR